MQMNGACGPVTTAGVIIPVPCHVVKWSLWNWFEVWTCADKIYGCLTSNNLQRLVNEIGYQDSSPRNGHQEHMLYFKMVATRKQHMWDCWDFGGAYRELSKI